MGFRNGWRTGRLEGHDIDVHVVAPGHQGSQNAGLPKPIGIGMAIWRDILGMGDNANPGAIDPLGRHTVYDAPNGGLTRPYRRCSQVHGVSRGIYASRPRHSREASPSSVSRAVPVATNKTACACAFRLGGVAAPLRAVLSRIAQRFRQIPVRRPRQQPSACIPSNPATGWPDIALHRGGTRA